MRSTRPLHEGRVPDRRLAANARCIDTAGKIDYAALYSDNTLDGVMVGLDRMHSPGSVLSSPAVVDGAVYFGSTDRNAYALRYRSSLRPALVAFGRGLRRRPGHHRRVHA